MSTPSKGKKDIVYGVNPVGAMPSFFLFFFLFLLFFMPSCVQDISYCKFGKFREGFIFAKLPICEVS